MPCATREQSDVNISWINNEDTNTNLALTDDVNNIMKISVTNMQRKLNIHSISEINLVTQITSN